MMKRITYTAGIILFILSIGVAGYAFRPIFFGTLNIVTEEFLFENQMYVFLAIFLAILSGVSVLFTITQSEDNEK